MTKLNEIKPELAKALVAACAQIGAAIKDSVNPHFKSRYADLAAVIDAVKSPLAKHGLCFLQNVSHRDDGVSVTTVILHESGQHLELAEVSVPASKQDPQGYGSAITYAKRYSLQSALGVPSEDDDGNAAAANAHVAASPKVIALATKEQIAQLKDFAGGSAKEKELVDRVLKRGGVTRIDDLPKDIAAKGLEFIVSETSK